MFPGQSGRLHRTDAGDWVWSSDDNESSESDSDDDESPDDNPDGVAAAAVKKSMSTSPGKTLVGNVF